MKFLYTLLDIFSLARLKERWLLGLFALQRAQFYEDLAEMFERNEALINFLDGELSGARSDRQYAKAMALRLMLRAYRRGEQAGRISHLLERVMPSSDTIMLVGVERASNKPQALRTLSGAIQAQQTMRRVVLGYCILPLIMAPLCYMIVLMLSRVVLTVEQSAAPEIAPLLWSGFNGVARTLAHAVSQHGFLWMSLLAALISLVIYTLSRWRGPMRLRIEGWPVYSLYRDFQAGLLFSAMAMLLQTGGTLKGSLEDIAQNASRWMRWHIFRLIAALDENPNNTMLAFSRGLVSRPLQARARTLLRTSTSLSDVLIELGTKEQSRVLARVKQSALVANAAVIEVPPI